MTGSVSGHHHPHHHHHHNGGGGGTVVDSGFSTEASNASNSNTSPRSSRFDTGSSSSDLGSGGLPVMAVPPPAPMEKELVQHLERVQQRLARLKKDEDRLLTLLNPSRHRGIAALLGGGSGGGSPSAAADEAHALGQTGNSGNALSNRTGLGRYGPPIMVHFFILT